MQFLRVAQQGATLASRDELLQWLAVEVRRLLPHDAILVAAGEGPRGGDLQVELAHAFDAPAPGSRPATGLQVPAPPAGMAWLAKWLRDGWICAHYLPCRIDLAAAHAPSSVHGLRDALVHGTRDRARDGQRVVALLGVRTVFSDQDAQILRLLVPFIDSAFRRVSLGMDVQPGSFGTGGLSLSERERQIMAWVAMGKTNPEIGCILCISEFTVKNHLKSIFAKLDVTNRAQAVAKLTRLTAHA